ncbi:MAG: DUF3488 and transglutaminase-like domain-containing protein [Azoarcus sp.]|jgi:transglutaminase-like putative cysteine protease|nr:DUF3488 and transglutaminase-like domain-containing protein [Azoarcus sp.]
MDMNARASRPLFRRAHLFFRGKAGDETALRRNQGVWMLTAIALTIAIHVPSLPNWTIASCALLLLWRGWRLWRGKKAPTRWLLLPLTIAATVGVRLSYGHFLGKAPGLTLLVMLLSLKLLETRDMRDIRAVVLLCFFLQFGLFFNDQSLPAAIMVLVAALVTLGSQISLTDPASDTRARLKTSALLLAQGLPFMIVLFLLFPRVISPLWGIPRDASATTGLSDIMTPGSISELVLSDALAFTATFDGPPPPPAIRYWRGPVLNDFDGRSWRLRLRAFRDAPGYTPSGRRFGYRLMLEPHQQHWLPALDYLAGPVQDVQFSRDFQAVSRAPISSRTQFSFVSFPDIQVGVNEEAWETNLARHLPGDGNPRARALAAELRADTPEQTVRRILAWLTAAGFIYTLQPPLLDADSIDFFLFETRMGFCEHFAGAFVFLARAAGVPARVVTGYQGGYINPVDGAMVVRQSDAHAWAEVWLDGRGWVRIDPTALVAPQRIDGGLADSLRTGDALPLMLRPEFSWLRQLRYRWEALNNEWNRMVIAYDEARQHDLLEKFGLNAFSLSKLFPAIIISTVLLMAMLYFWAQRTRNDGDPLDQAWARFSSRLARHSLARQSAEGPLDYGRRLTAARPADAEALTAICKLYARLRYRPPASREEIRALARAIAALRLEKDRLPHA